MSPYHACGVLGHHAVAGITSDCLAETFGPEHQVVDQGCHALDSVHLPEQEKVKAIIKEKRKE